MSEDYQYRLYEKKDEPEIVQLLRSYWGEQVGDRSSVLWDWKINRNPSNPPEGPRSYVATQQDKIIAIMATMPMRFKFRDQTSTFLWVVDYLADPGHKTVGWRIFLRLYKEPYVLTGTPNHASYTLAIATKWFEICPFYNHYSFIRLEKLLARKIKAPFVAAIAGGAWNMARFGLRLLRPNVKDKQTQIQEVQEFGPEFDALWEAVSGSYEVIGVRSSRYLTWKYLEIPRKKYRVFLAHKAGRPVGYIITCLANEEGYTRGEIVDFLTASDDYKTMSLLFRKAVEELKAGGADLINCFLIPYNKQHAKVLFQNGFFYRKKRYPVIAYQTKTADIPKAELIRAKWFVTGGDSDLTIF